MERQNWAGKHRGEGRGWRTKERAYIKSRTSQRHEILEWLEKKSFPIRHNHGKKRYVEDRSSNRTRSKLWRNSVMRSNFPIFVSTLFFRRERWIVKREDGKRNFLDPSYSRYFSIWGWNEIFKFWKEIISKKNCLQSG